MRKNDPRRCAEGKEEIKSRSCWRSATLKIRGGCDVDSSGRKAGKGPLVQWERSGTLGVSQDQTLFVWSESTSTNKP